MDNQVNMEEMVYPGQKVRITRIIQIVEEVVISDMADDTGISVGEAISDIPGIRSIQAILDRSDRFYNPVIEDVTVESVELL